MLIDMIISSFFDVIGGKLVSRFGLVLFIILLAIIFGAGQYLLLGFVKQVSKDLRKRKRDINLTYKLVDIIQYAVSGILILLITQIILGSYFSTGLIIAATLVSYIPATAIMGLLSYRFYSWYKSNRNAISLLFLIGSAMVGINLGVGVTIHSYYIWSKKPIEITAQPQVNFPKITPQSIGILSAFYLYAFFIPLNLAYLFAWGGCVVLLHYYSRMLGNIRYWIIISTPLVMFLISLYPTFLTIPTGSFTFYDQNLIFFRILFRLAGTAGGVFIFCVALLSLARSIRKIHQTSTVADYMTISGYGVAILAIAVQSPIIHTPYPPFGIGASSFMTLASYLFSLGFYFSAVSVSQDEKLRRSIRKYVMEESNLLDSIGTAQMGQDIEKTVLKIAKEQQEVLTEQTGVEPSLTEDEVKEYLDTVLLEVEKMRSREGREG
jgi:MFS family permease